MVFTGKFAIGVIHLPRLPSIIHRVEERESIIEQAVREALLLEKLGFHGVLVENYGDAPYPKRVRDPLTISFMSVVVREVARSTSIPVGVNLLRNSADLLPALKGVHWFGGTSFLVHPRAGPPAHYPYPQ